MMLQKAQIYTLIEEVQKTPLFNYSREILKNTAYCLFIGSPYSAGNLLPNLFISGYIEIQMDGNIFRVHPCFSRKVY